MHIRPEVLILTNKYDFSCDSLAACLHDRQAPYLRINSDELDSADVTLDPVTARLWGKLDDVTFDIDPSRLRSIYFRCPAFLRQPRPNDMEEQLRAGQWQAFMRSMMVFRDVRWVNHPRSTYYAECKPIQLQRAVALGMNVPATIVTNSLHEQAIVSTHDTVAIKSVDTVLLRAGDKEAFVYTNLVGVRDIDTPETRLAPFILQQPLDDKVDIRVTVVGDETFAVAITDAGTGISGDWRKLKDEVTYTPFDLPAEVARSCIQLTADLGLAFGGVDLALVEGEYYFIEINPTGEWAWLLGYGLPIDQSICALLTK